MKRIFAAILTAVLLAAVCLTLTGCDTPQVKVASILNLTDGFKGTRTVTVVYPLSADIDAIKDDIIDNSPANEVEGATFTYLGATENGYSFELKFSFDNLTEYESAVSAVIGRDANAVLARKSTVMFSGTRIAEDFDVSELIAWVERTTKDNSSTKDYTFDCSDNKVIIGSDSYDSASTVSVNVGKGIPVNSVEIKTYNEKANLLGRTFDRSFVFSIPADDYSENIRKINGYFENLVGEDALISDTHEGNNILYTVTFEGLSLSELETTTASVLDSDGVSVYYGDKENMSTPLFEGRVLEETLDTLSFNGPSGNPPTLKYTYSLPTNAVKGEGALYKEGSWESVGTWDDGAYRMEDASGLTHLRIFDGRQYYIDGVSVAFDSLGDNRFRRTTSFLYPVEDGFEGPVYATKFFQSKGAETKSDNDGEHVLCSVICEGEIDDINASLENVFGSGNYIAYTRSNGSLSDKTTCTDYIDLRDILSVENAEVPMTYTAFAENGENIVTVTNSGAETAYRDKSSSVMEVKGAVAEFGYHAVIPKAGNIILYIIISVLLFGITTFVAYRMLLTPVRRERAENRRRKAGNNTSVQEEDPVLPELPDNTPPSAPTQTTTFSIFELGALSRNKKYVDEINQDVEKRIRADKQQKRKKEQRRKDKKAHGKEQPAENAPDDGLRTQELLDTLDQATKQAPEEEGTTDPMELLNLMNEEEQDD